MELSSGLLQLACSLFLVATACKAQEDFPICFACGCETCEVGHPRGVIHLPANLQGSLGNLEAITCFQFNQAGIGRLLPESICALNRLESFRSTCECPGGGGIVVQNEIEPTTTPREILTATPTSTPLSFDVIVPTDATSQAPQQRQRSSERPSAAPRTVTTHAPISPSVAPAANRKKSYDTVETSTSKKSSKRDRQQYSGMQSTGDTLKPIVLNSKGPRTGSEHESIQPKGSLGSPKKPKRPKKDRTEKKSKLKKL